jgi:hypothetical protein
VSVLALGLAGCMSMDGPCQVDVAREAGDARAAVQCEAGGELTIVAPGAVLEAAGRAAAEAPAASAGGR